MAGRRGRGHRDDGRRDRSRLRRLRRRADPWSSGLTRRRSPISSRMLAPLDLEARRSAYPGSSPTGHPSSAPASPCSKRCSTGSSWRRSSVSERDILHGAATAGGGLMAVEIERQWIAPDDVELPDRIGPFAAGSRAADASSTPTSTPPTARSARAAAAFGIRVQNGRRLATFKRSLEGAADGVRRREEVEGPADGDPELLRRVPRRAGAQHRPARTRGHASHRIAARATYRHGDARRRGRGRPPALSRRQHARRASRPRATRQSVVAFARELDACRSPASSPPRRRRAPSSHAGSATSGRTRGGIRTRTPFGSRV